jgi:hypothetical protein
MSRQCCLCSGQIQGRGCNCKCHDFMDVRDWETTAFIWICDARDANERRESWARFHTAYPHLGFEDHDNFWQRMLETDWYRREGHKHRHKRHHDYDDDDVCTCF